MDEHLQRETGSLVKSWSQHDPAMLRDYLVSDVEDPRINVQSILSRHFLVEALFGQRFAELREAELRFSLALNWLLKFLKTRPNAEERQALVYALQHGADNVEGMEIPHFLLATDAGLPATLPQGEVPNYLRQALAEVPDDPAKFLTDHTRNTFQELWRNCLSHENPPPITVLEPACGSANDYRFLDSFGLARFLTYTGFDLCEHNIANARALFPAVNFAVGNVFEIPGQDNAFDYCYVHDLLEHFSIPAMETAIAEISRVTRKAAAVHFFQMEERDDHVVRPVDDYHFNLLSMPRVRELFEAHGGDVQVIHIGSFLRWCFHSGEIYNENAYTLVVKFD